MRLFIAIELPDQVKRSLAGLRCDISGARWVTPEQLHLTLHFLGDVSGETLEQLMHKLSEVRVKPFELEIISTGCFPDARFPRVLWVGFKRQPELEKLAERVRSAAGACGIMPEKRAFNPHVTLARLKQPGAGDISCFLRQSIPDRFALVSVCRFVLFQSCLTQQGAIHKPVRLYPVKDAETDSENSLHSP